MENIIQAKPDIKAVFAHNDEIALGAIVAINSSGKDIMGSPLTATMMYLKPSKSINSETVAQHPQLIDKLAVEAGRDVIQGKKVEKNIAVSLKLVTKNEQGNNLNMKNPSAAMGSFVSGQFPLLELFLPVTSNINELVGYIVEHKLWVIFLRLFQAVAVFMEN